MNRSSLQPPAAASEIGWLLQGGALALVALGLAVAVTTVGAFSVLGAITALAFLLLGYPFVRGLRSRAFDAFDPIYLFVAYIAFTMFGRGLLVLRLGSPLLDPVLDTGSGEFRRLMAWVFGYSCLFLMALYVAYYSPLGRLLTRPLPHLPMWRPSAPDVVRLAVLSLLISAPAAWLLYLRIGGAVTTGDFFAVTRAGGVYWPAYCLRFALLGGVIAYAYASLHASRRGMALAAVYALSVALGVFLLFPTKGTIANVILELLVCTHYLRRHVSARAVVAAVVLGFFLYPLLMVYRNSGLQPAQILAMATSVPSQSLIIVRGLVERSYGADAFAMILDTTARTGQLEFGRTLLDLFWWYVPRGLWPQKPLTYGIEFGQAFLSQSGFYRGRSVSVAPSLIGELYLNFSWVGVVLGGLITGTVLKGARRFFVRQEANPLSVVCYAVFLAGAVEAVEGPIADHIEDTFITLVMACVLVVLANVAFLRPAREAPRC